ncbi:MAG: ABC transporter permease subunit [Anaerolineae bacterium]
MNMYWHEMRANLKALLLWSAGMLLMIAAGMMKYSGFVAAGESVNALFAQMPQAVQAMAGLNQFDLSKASGFYGVLFLYLVLMAAIHAAMLGANILAKEERDKTSEFLYVKPVSRSQVISAKLLAALTDLILLNLITYGASLLFVGYYGQGEDVSVYIRTLMAGLFFIQLLFLSLGSASAGLAKKPAAAAGIATGVLLVMYLLSVFIDLYDKFEPLKYLTPFKYFDAKNLLGAPLEPVYLVITAGLVIVFTVAAYVLYKRKDLTI